jgi:heptosyltransferase II
MPPQAENSIVQQAQPPFAAKRILVMRYRFIGDTILTVPFLRNLRRAFPQARIDVLVGPQSGKVLEGCPYVDELIEFDTTRFHKYDSGSGKKKSFWGYALDLRKRQYDTVFVLKRSLSSAFLALLTGAKKRIGYSANGRDFLLTDTAPFNTHIHEVESTLDVLRCAKVPIYDNHLQAWVSAEEKQQILDLAPELANIKKPILLHAAAAHPDKVYPLPFWAQIARTLSQSYGFTPVFSGAPLDVDLYAELEKLAGVPCLNLAGKLNLRQSMALYTQMQLAICVDSGPAHLSASVGTPTVAIFGPTDPVRWRTFGDEHVALYDEQLECRPCNYNKTCVDRPCLTQFDPAVVIETALKLSDRSALKSRALTP